MAKLSKSAYIGIVSKATHEFTKGKQTPDLEQAVAILEGEVSKMRAILKRREENKKA